MSIGTKDRFELDFNAGKIRVQEHTINQYRIFRVAFSDKRAPLTITRAVHAEAFGFWTSVPEGRQHEAEEVGAIISQYLASHDNNQPSDVLL